MKKFCFVIIALLLFLNACASEQESKALFEQKCIQCHSLEKSLAVTKTLPEWKKTVEAMVRYADGAITPAEADKIVRYLSARTKG